MIGNVALVVMVVGVIRLYVECPVKQCESVCDSAYGDLG